jgi:hypothetical protein
MRGKTARLLNPKNTTRVQAIALFILLAFSPIAALSAPNSSADRTRARDGSRSLESQLATPKDILIVDDVAKYAFFGWYRASQMSETGWRLLNRTTEWIISFALPNTTAVVLFTYDGTLDPVTDADGKAVYDHLVAWGYSSANISVHQQSHIGTLNGSYYAAFHLVIYAHPFDRDASIVVDSQTPFITFCAGQTDEMGIGTGSLTMHEYRDTFYVVSSDSYPTYLEALGPLTFESGMWVDATETAGGGELLITAEVESVCSYVETALTQSVSIGPGGDAVVALTIEVPDSPLADMYREAFFTDTSALVPGAEYEIPEGKAVEDTTELKEGVIDISLEGDTNGDGKVDIFDIVRMAQIYGVKCPDPRYDRLCDLDFDSDIDIFDLVKAAGNYGLTRENTGHLHVTGYYNGSPVACTNVYYVGPRTSAPINISECGCTWRYIRPGFYTIKGDAVGTTQGTEVVVSPQETSYAQLDFGGEIRPPPLETAEPVRDLFHLGITMDQAVQLGFDMGITSSSIIPLDQDNTATITANGYAPYLALPTDNSSWTIHIGPQDDNATDLAIDSAFTKIETLQQLLRSLPGEQYYLANWLLRINLPPNHYLSSIVPSAPLNWTVDFGGGTYMHAQITVADPDGVTVTETTVVTEQEITASEAYLNSTFPQYRRFSINYYSNVTAAQTLAQPRLELQGCELEEDWSKTWTKTISPGTLSKSWSYGSLQASVSARPEITVELYLGWHFSWWKLRWFKTYVSVTPSIRVEASASATASYTKTWSHDFATWSHRFSFWIGIVPVWANLKLTVTGSITVSASGTISVQAWVRAYCYFKAGVEWHRGSGWSGIWEHGSGAQKSITVTGSASLTVTPAAQCRLVFLIYDVAGPFATAKAYAPMTITYVVSGTDTWSIELKFKVIAGVTFAGWFKSLVGLSGWSKTLGDWTLASWSGTW